MPSIAEVDEMIQDHAEILIPDTRLVAEEEWLRMRLDGIGASEAGTVLNLNPYDSPYALWDKKVERRIDPIENRYIRWGKRLETSVLMGFAEDTTHPVHQYPKMLRSKRWPWMQANLDGIAFEEDPEGTELVLPVEVKTGDFRRSRDWEDEEGNAAVPDHYALQGQHQLAVTGLDAMWFAALLGGNDARYIKVERDDALIEDLVDVERRFWELVKTLEPPAVDGSEATEKALKRRYADPRTGSACEVPATALGLLERRRELKVIESETKAELKGIENRLREYLGNFERGLVNGVEVYRYTFVPATHVEAHDKAAYRRFAYPPKGGK